MDEMQNPVKNAVVEVKVSSDLLSAYVKLTEPEDGENPPTEVDVIKALDINQVSYGINTDLIKEICASPRYNNQIKIAEGLEPVKGEDAELIFKVNIIEKPKPVERKDGSVDFSNMNLFTEVVKGQVLCERIPPTDGTPGINVFGRPVPAMRGKDKPLPSGNNTGITEDEKELCALIDGRVDLVADRITVSQDFEVRGNVDAGTGNVKFKGNVSVTGNVARGYKVEATGNVDIFGMIEGGTVIAGGDVTVRGGIVGGGAECFVQCQGSLNCRYMENVTAIAIKDIRAQMILHSEIKCGNLVELYGSKAAIVGGECLCGGNIVLRSAGSPVHVKTTLEVGRDPTLAIRQDSLNEEIGSLNKSLSDLDCLEGVLNQLKNLDRLTEEKAEVLESIQVTKPVMQNKVNMISKELEEIKKKMWSTAPVEIIVTGIAYPGVEIRIGQAVAVLDTIMSSKRFSRKDDIIIAR